MKRREKEEVEQPLGDNLLVRAGVAFVGFYRKFISPCLHAMFGPTGFCRFTPTCSEYARQALLTHGFFKGGVLAAWRILRCNPLCKGGRDPVPPRGQWRLRRERIGIFGGSFDPVHNAHLALAESARRALRIDRLVFVSAAQSPLKNAPQATDAQRVAMLRSALDTVPAMPAEISTWELSRGGKSWTIDTVEHFEETFPRARLFLIMGADQLKILDRWHRADALCRKVVFAVMRRDGETLPAVPAPLRAVARIVPLDTPPLEISSTEIRLAVASGNDKKLRGCVPAPVLTIIREEKIYRSDYADSPTKNAHACEAHEENAATRAAQTLCADKACREPCRNDR